MNTMLPLTLYICTVSEHVLGQVWFIKLPKLLTIDVIKDKRQAYVHISHCY